MGEQLHEAVRKAEGTRCRIYAPVGAHSDLLAYLVRRLLENGANSSFVHQLTDEDVPPEDDRPRSVRGGGEPGAGRQPGDRETGRDLWRGSEELKGFDITDPVMLAAIEKEKSGFSGKERWSAAPITRAAGYGSRRAVTNPAKVKDVVGAVTEAGAKQVSTAVRIAVEAQPAWAKRPVAERAAILRRAADLYEANAAEFFALATREAGKTLADGIAEVREAVDFLRYYAAEAANAEAGTEARGVIACISPWNFPLAIFTGQIAAALVTGNSVIAKPAEQTPLIAARAVALLREAGVPEDVIQLLPGDGPSVGAPLTADPRIAGVCFTGSTDVAKAIERQLAKTAAPDAMLIAETGGLNAMIVDSTALPEQAVRDILASAFQSAGQRCSALRILYVQKDVEKKMIEMLKGALEALVVGDPVADFHRCRAADRRGSAEGDRRLLRGDGSQGPADRQARRAGRRALRRAAHFPRLGHRGDGARDLRAGAACREFRRRRHRQRHRVDQPQGLRPDLRPAHAHRGARAALCRRHPCRQHLRQPQPDRRGRRLAAVWRRRALGHRAESWRAALSQALPQVGFAGAKRAGADFTRGKREPRGAEGQSARTRHWAAGRRAPTALPCCASICAAKAPPRSRLPPASNSGRSTCRVRPARPIR